MILNYLEPFPTVSTMSNLLVNSRGSYVWNFRTARCEHLEFRKRSGMFLDAERFLELLIKLSKDSAQVRGTQFRSIGNVWRIIYKSRAWIASEMRMLWQRQAPVLACVGEKRKQSSNKTKSPVMKVIRIASVSNNPKCFNKTELN